MSTLVHGTIVSLVGVAERQQRRVVEAAQALIDSIKDDETYHGGLLRRETLKAADEAQAAINEAGGALK